MRRTVLFSQFSEEDDEGLLWIAGKELSDHGLRPMYEAYGLVWEEDKGASLHARTTRLVERMVAEGAATSEEAASLMGHVMPTDLKGLARCIDALWERPYDARLLAVRRWVHDHRDHCVEYLRGAMQVQLACGTLRLVETAKCVRRVVMNGWLLDAREVHREVVLRYLLFSDPCTTVPEVLRFDLQHIEEMRQDVAALTRACLEWQTLEMAAPKQFDEAMAQVTESGQAVLFESLFLKGVEEGNILDIFRASESTEAAAIVEGVELVLANREVTEAKRRVIVRALHHQHLDRFKPSMAQPRMRELSRRIEALVGLSYAVCAVPIGHMTRACVLERQALPKP